ncbi:hypothetical protein [Acidovorax soli]|uniref:hypothetical protein n=1 Tax=Acidovorax soli TaxID=592050 RepID=UPI0032B2FE3E
MTAAVSPVHSVRRRLALALPALLLAALPLGLRAEAGASLRASEVFEPLVMLERLPESQRHLIGWRYTLQTIPPGGTVKAWYLDQGQRVEIPIAADGSFERPAALTRPGFDPLLQANRPERELKLDAQLMVRAPDFQSLRYADLQRAAQQMNGFIKSQAGLLSFLAPKVQYMDFHCQTAGDCLVELKLPQGTRRLTPDAQGRIGLALSAELEDVNPEIQVKGRMLAITGRQPE